MSTRGRKPKHPGLEVLDGGHGKRAQQKTVEIPSEYPACPPDFEHAELWAELQGLFEENGTPIRSSDKFAIEDLSSLISEVRALRKIPKGGRTTPGERNKEALRAHPLASQLKAARDSLWRAFERFGLTPVDSARLPLKSRTKTPRRTGYFPQYDACLTGHRREATVCNSSFPASGKWKRILF